MYNKSGNTPQRALAVFNRKCVSFESFNYSSDENGAF